MFQSSVGNTSLQSLGIHYSNAFYSTLLSFFVLKIFWFHFQIQTICTELIVASLYECVIVVITIPKHWLWMIHSNKQSLFEMSLEKDDSVSVHNWNLQILATKIYKIKNDLSSLKLVSGNFWKFVIHLI